ncbi:hypothetical protein GGX14DRAFT_655939 [Mycena pura]|uniref:DUF6532 domain-containing protein n=1 Tax=Mycena pura TaxID=153505 RepID=A0AAD6V356_9AGAR|nr:hypothetical protein GGX14DRAFT_655939 [Mycena pura]
MAGKAKAPAKRPGKPKAKPSELEVLLAKSKQTEKLLKLANAQLLAKRNSDMLDDEENAAARPKKKAKGPRASSGAPSVFGADDAAAMDGLIGSARVSVGAAESGNDSDQASDAGSNPRGVSVVDDDDGEEEDEDDELPGSSISTRLIYTVQMVVDELPPQQKSARRTGAKGRVTQSTFSPTSVRLANVGRHAVRVQIATDEAFPTDHAEFTWQALSNAVAVSQAPALVERLAMANNSDARRSQLSAYSWGGASQLRGEVKTLCKAAVELLGIPGDYTPAEIVGHVAWLTGRTSIFKFGNINLATRTYDLQQPYGAPFYKNVITKQWFDTVKSEGVRSVSCQHFVDAPGPTITLVTGVMENALSEWASGVRITVKYSEEGFAARYQHHRAALLNLQTKSPNWFAQFQHGLYAKIILTSNFPHLKTMVADAEEDEFAGVDFAALEATASAKTADIV